MSIDTKLLEKLFTENPRMQLLYNNKLEMIDCNQATMDFFGFTSKDEALKTHRKYTAGILPPTQPDGRKTRPLQQTLEIARDEGYIEQEVELIINDRPIVLNTIYKRIDVGKTFYIGAYLIDLQSLREARNEVIRRDHLRAAINAATSILIASRPDNFGAAIFDAMQIIGRTVDVDRMYIWENFEKDGRLWCRQTYEWSEGAEPVQGEDFTIASDYAEMHFWYGMLSKNKTINILVSSLSGFEYDTLTGQGILSLLVIPIYLEGRFWGFIGFDDCHNERHFSEHEESILRSASNMLVSSIVRNTAAKSLMEVKNELQVRDDMLSAVNLIATKLMAAATQILPRQTLLDVLRILGESIQADRVYLWKNAIVDGVLCSSEMEEWSRVKPSFITKEATVNLPYEKIMPAWQEALPGYKPINVITSELPPELTRFPNMRDVKSILVVPLYLEGSFWGFIGIDDCQTERLFPKQQQDIIESGCILIASAIFRHEMMQKLIRATEEAQASTKAKGEFLARMTHEIRTPMNAIVGMNAIAQKADSLFKVKKYLEKVDASSRQLMSIINDVLDMSKIEANKLEISNHPFDMEDMIQQVVNVVKVKFNDRGQHLYLDIRTGFERLAVSDELRLSQVLINLLNNANKFTDEGGHVWLKIWDIPVDDNNTVLHAEVMDDGIGISPEQQRRLFKSFEQADGSITRQYGGTGLGLAICKNIVNLMGGDIWVESEAGKGSSFIFEVPLQWDGPRPQTAETRELPQNLHVLTVDDDPAVLEYIQQLLGEYELDSDTAQSGPEAITKVTQALKDDNPYNLIFVDWHMPGMNGTETACKIKDIMQDDVVMVLISSLDWVDLEPEMTRCGLQHFLSKPILPSVLYNSMVRLTSRNFVKGGKGRSLDGQEQHNWQGKKVLLVEDIDINREIVATLLEDTQIALDYAENGAEAVEKFKQHGKDYDLILMDVQMPVMDGLEATKAIRALNMPYARAIPIIAMTAHAFDEDVQRSTEAGMNGHISKPIEIDYLFKTLAQFLN